MKPLHFSDLKRFGRSPAHYLAGLDSHTDSPSMMLGRVIHAMVLGRGEWQVYDGRRAGKEWEAFKAAQSPDCDIIIPREYDIARAVAQSVITDPVAGPLINGSRHELAVEWDYAGRRFATRGIDIIGELDGGAPFIADLKTARTTAPWRFPRACEDMAYDAQLALYDTAARSLGVVPAHHYIIGVETSAPHAVTVLRLTPARLELGKRRIHAWLEALSACESSGHWPGYVQSVVEWDAPPEPLMFGGDDGEDENEDEEAAE